MTQNVDPDEGGFAFGGGNIDWEAAAAPESPGKKRKQATPAPAPVTAQPTPTQAPLPVPQPVPQPIPQPAAQRHTPPSIPQAAPRPAPVPTQHVPPTHQAQGLPQQPVQPVAPQQPAHQPVPSPIPMVKPQPVAPAQPQAPAHVPVQAPHQVQAPAQMVPASPVQPVLPPVAQPYSTTPTPGYEPVAPAAHDDSSAHTAPLRASMEDLAPPDWANIVPRTDSVSADSDDAEPTFVGDDELFPAPKQDEPEEVETGTNKYGARPKKGKRAPKPRPEKKPKGGKKKELTAKEIKAKEFGGARMQIKVVRYVIFGVLGLLILGGVKNVIIGKSIPTVDQVTAEVSANLGVTDYPTASAEAFAVRFAKEYLTYSPSQSDVRAHRLSFYSPAAAAATWGWDGTGSQSVITGPYVSAKTAVKDKTFATITVTAQVNNGDWVTLAVPVYAPKSGGMVIAGAPAYVGNPPLVANPGEERTYEVDQALSGELQDTLLPGFFAAWASSDSTTLARYISKDASLDARIGLDGTVTFKEIENVQMEAATTDERHGVIRVSWQTASGSGLVQDYDITVAKTTDDQWSVKDIKGGVIANSTEASSEYSDNYEPDDGSTPKRPVTLDDSGATAADPAGVAADSATTGE